MKTKLKVEFNGQTFTRTTARTYTHLVVAKNSKSQALKYAHNYSDCNAQYYISHALGTAKVYSFDNKEEIARLKAKGQMILDMGIEAYQAKVRADEVARIEKAIADGKYDKYYVVGWSGKLDLARKVASTVKYHDGLEILEVK